MIRLALSRPVSTIVAVLAACVLGAMALAQLPVSLLPDLERPHLLVTASAPDASRDVVLHALTEPLERRLAGLPGIVRTTSRTEARRSA